MSQDGLRFRAPRSGAFTLRLHLLVQTAEEKPQLVLSLGSGGTILHEKKLERFRTFKRERKRKSFFSPELTLPLKLKNGQEIELKIDGLEAGADVFLVSSYLRSADEEKKAKDPNIILISIDTLRADYLDAYREILKRNQEFPPLSPNINKLGAQSTLYLNVQTTISATWPALSSLFTSLYPFQHGVVENGMRFPRESDNLAKRLFDRGYYTLSFNSNAFRLDLGGFHRVVNAFHSDKDLKEKALRTIPGLKQKAPFFMWMHFIGVHASYTPDEHFLRQIEPQPLGQNLNPRLQLLSSITKGEVPVSEDDIRHIRNCYAGELLQLDSWLGEIFALLKENGLWEDSLIILTSDHGEDLYQHHNYFFHHPSPYQTSLHIPLLVKEPGQRKGAVSSRFSSIVDIAPTILDLLNDDIPDRYEGLSLKRDTSGERILFAESSGSEVLTIRNSEFSLISNLNGVAVTTPCGHPYPIEKYELYNLKQDPYERRNLASIEGEVQRRMQYELFRLLKSLRFSERSKMKLDASKLSPEVLQELKSLGYL